MEKKLKFSEFAVLIGVTAKTVYKMAEREEIKTVIEKVNNRSTQLVVTNEDEILKFRNSYRKDTGNNGNYEDMLTDSEATFTNSNASQNSVSNEFIQEMFDKIMQINKEYNNHINKLNEELTNSKAQLLYLEDKAGREGMYLKEINELKSENNKLTTGNKILLYTLLTVVIGVLFSLTVYFTYNIASKTQEEQKNEPVVQEVVKPAPQAPVTNKKRLK